MSDPINYLQTQFQLSFLKLALCKNGSEPVSATPRVEIAEQLHLPDALAKMANAIH